MCLSLLAKGEIDTEEVLPSIRIRKRYRPGRKEMVFELVRSRPKNEVVAKFWICVCGLQMEIDVAVCSGCGKHRKHRKNHDRQVSDELEKVGKAYDSLKKELQVIEKDLKDVQKDCTEKKECDKDQGKGEGCKCAKEKKEEKNSGCCKCDEKEEKNAGGCKCDEKRKEKKRKDCHCPSPIPPPQQPNPLPPCIPVVPAPYFEPTPKPGPPPEPRPICPVQEPPIVNVIVPDYRQRKRKHSRRRERSPSVSSSSTVSVRSFERIRHRVSRLGKRLWGLEGREQILEDEFRLRRLEEERALQREERARERAKQWDLEFQWDRGRDRGEERALWRRKEYLEVEGNPMRMSYPFPILRKDDFRFRHQHRRFDDDGGFGRM
ncbi:MAG: hypothetical protein GOMPHAMPRED_002603 [Gomphillus americanus]|uniref:Uncharacterized protein n=1 Tax=Gomphillus americanus TaxID=1940652 RepID=A0A8H3FIG7_9LECA|nr:MAG: hypothetical protein GOMPHAMPRED_002603 [Gomphillus americanus]